MIPASILTAMLLLGADAGNGVRWTFEDAAPDRLPEGWSSAKTGTGPGSVWKVVEDESAPSGKHVLAQTSAAAARPLFNLCVLDEASYGGVRFTVSFKAVTGTVDQGGGPVWRYQDADNYYICRHNPLEDNFRVYKVVGGVRTQLASVDLTAEAGKWHTIEVVMLDNKIVCSINGNKLEVRDGAITMSGKVGLWTKADAVTYFDDFHVQRAK
jgi:hypothetical protein